MKYSTMKLGALGLAVVASLGFVAPGPASVRPEDRAGLRGVGAASVSAQVRPDDRSGLRGVDVTSPTASVRPDDRAGFRGPLGAQSTIASGAQPAVSAAEGSFDWAAAGAGAGTATAVMLVLTGALMLRRNHRRAGMPA
jgi:hypothetical protein